MNINVYLDDELGSLLTQEIKQSGRSRNALIREAIREWFVHHKTQHWPTSVMQFNGICDFPAIQSYRDELSPPKEDPLE